MAVRGIERRLAKKKERRAAARKAKFQEKKVVVECGGY